MRHYFILTLFLIGSLLLFFTRCSTGVNPTTDWPIYGGSNEKTHYVTQTEITPENLHRLTKVWEYRTGDAAKGTQIQTNPLVIDGVLYGISPQLKLFALQAKTGQALWTFDPFALDLKGGENFPFSMNVSRGITHYKKQSGHSILFYGVGSYLIAVNAQTGSLYSSFGKGGMLDLHTGLGEHAKDLYVAATTPGILFKNLLIIGTRVNEGLPAAPGNIRAFNADTGALVWNFHTIPQPGKTGHETWKDPNAWTWAGGANAWAGFSLDQDRGIVYAPTGSASYDFYGANRLGNNLFANSIIALDAKTGVLKWHYQTVHHDVWDRDLPTPPVLFDYTLGDKKVPALAQVTKSGLVFVLNRISGKPLYEIQEEKVPTNSPLAGEHLSQTQPIPTFFSPFSRHKFTEKDLNPFVSPEEKKTLGARLNSYRKEHLFAPPSQEGTLIFPGYDGGAEWGGPALDPESQWLYVNTNEMPWVLTMVPQVDNANNQSAEQLYSTNCLSCHGNNFKGGGHVPSLLELQKRFSPKAIAKLIKSGKRMMPAFAQLDEKSIARLTDYLFALKPGDIITPQQALSPKGYLSTGYHKFLTQDGYPAISPPWGTLTALDLTSGKIAWKTPLGNTPIGEAHKVITGTENYGGPLVTQSGLVFIAATSDQKIRAFNKNDGSLLWEADLPFSGFATPALVNLEKRSYLIIACGGGKLNTPSGDAYVAFALE
ncbi:MAG: PQQ-binding-like beta-propeller repeat protein [Flavobacteriaceae bacterium]